MGILDKVKDLGKKGIEKGTELGVKGIHEAKESAKKEWNVKGYICKNCWKIQESKMKTS